MEQVRGTGRGEVITLGGQDADSKVRAGQDVAGGRDGGAGQGRTEWQPVGEMGDAEGAGVGGKGQGGGRVGAE